MVALAVYLLSPKIPKVQAGYLKKGEECAIKRGNFLHYSEFIQQ